MTCGPRLGGRGGASSTSGKRGKEEGLFCAVRPCRTDGIKSSHLATSTGLSRWLINFSYVVFLLQLKRCFTSCGATSPLGQRLSTLLQILLKYEFSRGQYPVLSCASQIHPIRGNVCSAIIGGGVTS